jgi:hypothetical protein
MNKTFVDMRYQSSNHGQDYYDEYAASVGGLPFAQVYQAIWKVLFEPSPGVQERLEAHPYYSSAIHKPEYVSLHIRSLYHRNKTSELETIRNAVHCAYQTAVNESITALFVATDHAETTQYAMDYAKLFFAQVLGRNNNNNNTPLYAAEPPLHLDRGRDYLDHSQTARLHDDADAYWNLHKPHDFYAVFEDLYLLAGGKCHVHGMGGFGYWAAMLSSNSSATRPCVYNHAIKGQACPVPTLT